MKLMDKYLLREYLVPVAYCLTAFCMIYVIYDLLDHLSMFIEAGTPLLLVGRYYLFLLAPSIEYLVPASLLLATLYTLWRLARNNELTAMRASGVSLYRIMAPFLVVGLIFSVFTAVMKETLVPQASQWAADFAQNRGREPDHKKLRNQAYYNTIARRVWEIEEFDLKTPHLLKGVTIKHEREDGSTVEKICAKKAEWLDSQWWFYDAWMQKYHDNESPDGKPIVLPPVMEMRLLTDKPSDYVNEVKNWEFLSSLEMARYLASHTDLSDETIAQRSFDMHSRLAMPWACLIVTLFGIPAGAKSERQSTLTGICFAVAVFFGFYALTQIGILLGKRQIVWPWFGAWLSNIVFLAAGVQMVRRMR